MRPLTPLLLLVTLCLGCAMTARAGDAPASTTWMTVLLGGRKIGHIELERRPEGSTIVTSQALVVEFNRTGNTLQLGSTSRSVESLEGTPLGFESRTRLSARDSTVEGHRLADGQYLVTTTVGDRSQQIRIPWPRQALLAEAQRRAILAAGRGSGVHYRLLEFNPASQRVVEVDMQVIGDEEVRLPEGPEVLSHQRQILGLAHGNQALDLWLDQAGVARKGEMQLLGQTLEMLACSRACALAPNQDVDMFRAAMVTSPRVLTANLRQVPMRFRVVVTGSDPASPFIGTDEQRVTPLGRGQWLVDVTSPHAGGELPPQPDDRTPNAWLQSDAQEIRQLAARAVGDAGDDRTRMRRLVRLVSGYITQHGLDIGYASSLEVVKSHQGDCTEYAVLLAALARAQGIPTRVVSGLVYADRYAGFSRVFVPHEWVQSWVDGRWQSYDAALGHFDASHLALASGDGDPWHFFAATRSFGHLHIVEATPGFDLFPSSAPAAPAVEAPAAGPGH